MLNLNLCIYSSSNFLPCQFSLLCAGVVLLFYLQKICTYLLYLHRGISNDTREKLADLFLSTVVMVNRCIGAPFMSTFYSRGARV